MKDGPRTLIIAVNWLGDSCMALPAIRRYRELHPSEHIAILAKPHLHAFWHMVPTIDDVIPLGPGGPGLVAARSRLSARGFSKAVVLPNSWRSALAPWLAGIPRRVGVLRGWRRVLLTHTVMGAAHRDASLHQMWEYTALLDVDLEDGWSQRSRLLCVPAPACRSVAKTLEEGHRWVGVLPGAARGPAKQWPWERFADVGQRVCEATDARIVVLGAPAEAEVCAQVTARIGNGALNLGGMTSLQELAVALGRCTCVLCNDSGGMHLAAVMGTPVVAVFGITDPARTGPIGQGHRLVMAEGVERSRDIDRHSSRAKAALESIRTECVLNNVLAQLGARPELVSCADAQDMGA